MNEGLEGMIDEKELDESIKLSEEELREGKKQRDRDNISRVLKDLINTRNPLKWYVKKVLEIYEALTPKLKALILDNETKVAYISPAAKRSIGYEAGHDTPLIGQLYHTLLYPAEATEFRQAVEHREKILQRVVLTHREGNRIHLDSRIRDYICTPRGDLVGIAINWSKVTVPFPTEHQKNKLKN